MKIDPGLKQAVTDAQRISTDFGNHLFNFLILILVHLIFGDAEFHSFKRRRGLCKAGGVGEGADVGRGGGTGADVEQFGKRSRFPSMVGKPGVFLCFLGAIQRNL